MPGINFMQANCTHKQKRKEKVYKRHKQVWFSLWSFGAIHFSCLQDYQKVLPKPLHSNMPEGQWKGSSTCRSLLPEDANQVL